MGLSRLRPGFKACWTQGLRSGVNWIRFQSLCALLWASEPTNPRETCSDCFFLRACTSPPQDPRGVSHLNCTPGRRSSNQKWSWKIIPCERDSRTNTWPIGQVENRTLVDKFSIYGRRSTFVEVWALNCPISSTFDILRPILRPATTRLALVSPPGERQTTCSRAFSKPKVLSQINGSKNE